MGIIKNGNKMNNWTKIEEIAKEVLNSFNGYTAHQINNGDCATFAKRMHDKLQEKGIESEIIITSKFTLEDELDGYETIESDYDEGLSHCYLKIDGWFFDAYDMEGSETEEEMQYHIECENYANGNY